MKTTFSTTVPGFPAERRIGEPITVGIPLPKGVVPESTNLAVIDSRAEPLAAQYEVLERWPDGSIRWVLLDSQLNVPETFSLIAGKEGSVIAHPDPILLTRNDNQRIVTTGGRQYIVEPGTAHILRTQKAGEKDLTEGAVVIHITAQKGVPLEVRFEDVTEERTGPLRTTLCLSGVARQGNRSILDVTCRLSCFAGLETVRLDVTVRNPRGAKHPGGFWELGDPGSILLQSVSIAIQDGSSHDRACLQPRPGDSCLDLSLPLVIHQESSGGANWQSTVHVNRYGNVPVRFRGYRLLSPGEERTGDRATPVVWFLDSGHSGTAVAVRHFWQNFPKALEATPDRLDCSSLPGRFGRSARASRRRTEDTCRGRQFRRG